MSRGRLQDSQVQILGVQSPMNPQPQPSRFTSFSMRWSPEEQSVCCDADTFTHRGPSITDPSHDLAHLLIAASGTLPWKPGGYGKKAKLAEYNAFLIENILDMTYNCISYKSIQADQVLAGALSRARWFVEEHYSPFPMSAAEAFSEFRRKIDGALIVRQSTRFFNQKARERCDPNFRKRTYELSFKLNEFPPMGRTPRAFQEVVFQIMSNISSRSYCELLSDTQRKVPIQGHDCSFCGLASSFLHQMKLFLN
jgi:hypothetical protein